MTITADQLAQLQSMVATLVTDKGTADAATVTSNAAHAALQTAQTAVASADTAEATADGVVNGDLASLQTFIDGLAAPVVPPAPPSA